MILQQLSDYLNKICRDFTNPNLLTEHKGKASQMANSTAIVAAFGGGLPPGITRTNDRCTLLVSNLDPDVSILSGIFYKVLSIPQFI
ncbi:hypothetical protein RJT34_21612 [Clitoria ternatea]|uniref:Uncharacterized protein n=1 Tax=Clitoria ternatea TaxID=43366 RepID=A0AAN9IUS4_CLITE